MLLQSKVRQEPFVPPVVWHKIEMSVAHIAYGSISLIAQDGKIIQMEINEKIRLLDSNIGFSHSRGEVREARKEILQAVTGLEYGQVVINIKGGAVVQIDRTEKQRLRGRKELTGT